MSGIANEASSLPSRASQAFRSSQPKTGIQEPGAFAALMDCQSEPAPAPKPAQKADKPAPSEEGYCEALPPPREPSSSDNTSAETVPVEGKPESNEEAFCEAIKPIQPEEAASDTTTAVDPAAAVISTTVVPDPNAAAVPAVVVPAAPVLTNAEGAADTTEKPVTADAAAAAPALPAADETTTQQAKKAAGNPAPQAKAAQQNTEAPAEDGQAEETASAEQPQAAHKHAKPEALQQHADGAQHEVSGEKPQTRSANDLDTGTPLAKAAAEPAQVATPAPVVAHAAAAPAAHSQAAPANLVQQPVPINALAVEIAGQARAGNSRFEIRLDPPELGRIDVRLDVDRDGNVTSRLVIERADTYDLLRRDQSTLERALQQAGLKTSDNALEFSLRDQGFAQRQQQDDTPARTTLIADADASLSEAANGYARLLRAGSGIDIRV